MFYPSSYLFLAFLAPLLNFYWMLLVNNIIHAICISIMQASCSVTYTLSLSSSENSNPVLTLYAENKCSPISFAKKLAKPSLSNDFNHSYFVTLITPLVSIHAKLTLPSKCLPQTLHVFSRS